MQKKSWLERVFHAVCFEVVAILICAPIGAYVLARPLFMVGFFTLIIATIAMLWNITYNTFFDYFWPASKVHRRFKVRLFHALGFEAGFIVIGTLIASWMLNVSLINAFILEIGIFLFFVPYTMVFNWIYDILRNKVVMAKIQNPSSRK